VREVRDAGDELRGVLAVGQQRVLAENDAGRQPVQAVPSEDDGPELLGVHEQEAHPVVVDEAGQQVGPVPLDLLQRHPSGDVGERHHRGVAGDDADDAGRHSRHLTG
jgi:hypothetical protein